MVTFGAMQIVALWAMCALTGCSLLTVKGPDQAQVGAPMCTRDARLPIVVDGLGALVIGGTGLAAAGEGSDSETKGAGYALIGIGVLAAVSAIVGIKRQDECAQAWDSYTTGGR